MKKFMLVAFALFINLFIGSTLVYADDPVGHAYVGSDKVCAMVENASVAPELCDGGHGESDLYDIISNVINVLFVVVGVVAVIVIIYGGIIYMTATGDPGKIAAAKKAIMYSVIGLIIAISAFAIVNFILLALDNGAVTGGSGNSGSGGGGSGGSSTSPTGPGGNSSVFAPEISEVMTSASKKKLEVGESIQLDTTYRPANAKNAYFTYKSSNSSVAGVGTTGLVVAKSAGTATITVTSRNGKSASVDITVIEIVKPQSVTVSPASVTLKIGESKTIAATVKPDNAKDKSVKWSSSNTAIATVDNSGKITGKKEGTATITVKTVNKKSATVAVTVKKEEAASTPDPGSDTSGRHKIGGALAVLHAANRGDLDKIRTAANKKYYAVECDLAIRGSTMYCYHDNSYASNNTLAETMNIAKAKGTKVIIDHISNSHVQTLANYIKSNNLQNYIIVQTNSTSIMSSLNSAVGTKLEYWGLFMSGNVNSFTGNNARNYESYGMTTVNIASGGRYDTFSSSSNISAIKRAGLDVCVFTWNRFSSSKASSLVNAGAKYLMTNDASQ